MRTETLIAALTRDLTPVRRLRGPGVRIAVWLLLMALVGGVMAARADLPEFARRIAATPDMWLAVAGSVATAIAASVATFLVSLADRPPRWAWLPVPPLLLWVAASGLGCLRPAIPGLHPATLVQSADECLPFILGMALPVAAAMFLLLRPVATLRPGLTTLTAGLAVAATTASLLWLIHPFDAGATDLLVHAASVALVLVAVRLVGGVALRPPVGGITARR